MDVRHAVGVKSGIPVAKLAALPTYETAPAFTDGERAALCYGEQRTRARQSVSGACMARLRGHFSEAEVVELTFIVGFQTFVSQFARALDVRPQGFSG